MKKILMIAVVFMFSMTLFAQTKIPETNKDLTRIIQALEKNGIEYYDIQVFPEDKVDFFMTDAITVDDFIQYLETLDSTKSSTMNNYELELNWEYLWGIGLFWEGVFTSGPTSITGTDWEGIYHYVININNPSTHLFEAWTHNPYRERIADCNYCGSNYYKACGSLYESQRIYVQGFGYIVIKVPYGNNYCETFPNV